jgi:flagella basal body P-ring formation protein FlgA
MKYITSAFIAIGLAMIITAIPAMAANLNQNGQIDGDHLRLRHVFIDAPAEVADHVLADAPRPGQSITLTAHDLNRIANAFDLNFSANPTTAITLTRSATVIPADKIADAIKVHLNKTEGISADIAFTANNPDIILPADKSGKFSVENVTRPENGNFLTARLNTDGGQKTIQARLIKLVEVPVLRHRLRHGDIITERDIEYRMMDQADIRAATIIDARHLVNMTPRRVIDAGTLIRDSEIDTPMLVKRKQLVTMKLQSKTLSLTAKGQALHDAAMGEIVRVRNLSSDQIVEGMVTGPKMIDVSLGANPNAITMR